MTSIHGLTTLVVLGFGLQVHPSSSRRDLLADLASNDRTVRIKALSSVAELGDKAGPAIPFLIDALSDRDERIVVEALRSLSTLGKQAKPAISEIARLIESDNFRISDASNSALLRLKSNAEETIPTLVRHLTVKSPIQVAVRKQIPLTLWEIAPNDKAVVRELRRAISHSEPLVRLSASYVLWKNKIDKDEPLETFKMALASGNLTEKKDALQLLQRIGPSAADVFPSVAKLAKDGNERIRLEVVWTVHAIDPCSSDTIKLSMELLRDDSSQVRSSAATFLGNLGPKARSAVKALEPLLGDKEPIVQVSSAQALHRIDPSSGRQVIPVLVHNLMDSEPLVRGFACEVLGEIGPCAAEAIPMLRRATTDSWEDVRKCAREAIRRIGQK